MLPTYLHYKEKGVIKQKNMTHVKHGIYAEMRTSVNGMIEGKFKNMYILKLN